MNVTLRHLGITVAFFVICACAGAAGVSARTHRTSKHKTHKARRHGAAIPAPTDAFPAPTIDHVATWAIDDGCNGGTGAGSALVRRWVTFAESNCGTNVNKARFDCHARGRSYCDVLQYLDTGWEFGDGSAPAASASSYNWWLHETAPNQGARIYSSGSGGGYLMNQLDPSMRSFFQSYVRTHFNTDDGLLMDWQSPSLSQELYYSTCGCSATSEIDTNAALQAAHREMAQAVTHRNGSTFVQVDNTLPPNPDLPQGLTMLDHNIGVDGWIVEGEPENYGTLDPYYSTLLDQIAYVATKTKGFVVPMSRSYAGAPNTDRSRRVQEATILLGYSPGHLVDWADLEQGSGDLAVWPEEGIYPRRPLQSMKVPRGRGCLAGKGVACTRGGHNSLQVASGVYRREFRGCYRQGAAFGRCAAIVNTTTSPVIVQSRWLKRSYGHQIALIGGDAQSGGSIALHGLPFSAGSTVLAPDDAMILAR